MDDSPTIQKLKGKLKQAEGKLQEVTGDKIEGKVKQVEGRAQEEIAELRVGKSKAARKADDDIARREQSARVETARTRENLDEEDDF